MTPEVNGAGTRRRGRGGIARVGVSIAAAAALIAGCGGDDGPTAEERRAAMARWQQHADAACERAEQAIVARGEPIDAVDVDRIVVRSTTHLRRAAETIRELRIPPGGAAKVRPVLKAIDDLEQPLKDLGEWSEVRKQDEIVKAAKEWRLQAVGLERAAGDAGLRVCGRDGQRHAAADAIIAPIFASQLVEFVDTLLYSVRSVRRKARVNDTESLSAYLDEFSAVVEESAQRYYALEPPMRAADESGAYHEVLLDTADFAGRAATDAKRRGYTLPTLNALEKRFDQLGRRERRTYRALARALRPIPGTEGEEENPLDPEGEQES